ncbi:MAG: hypothetical protein LBR25_05255 [Erysipelotrichaceae bacterium]|jgi:hypothetical protein|nr:hypothetical protein [Erysipelotrichaceae bacterium]
MKQNKVVNVLNTEEVWLHVLWLTKRAEETAYRQLPEVLKQSVTMEDFLKKIQEEKDLKAIIRKMVLSALHQGVDETLLQAISS